LSYHKIPSKEKPAMTHQECTYRWTGNDKQSYFLSLTLFLIPFVGAACVLANVSIYLLLAFIGLYILANIFQAGACVGCPYRGKFCPAIFGVYFSNVISSIIYKNRTFEQRFFNVNANLASITCIVTLLFPICWLVLSGWYFAVGYLGFLAVYWFLFSSFFCLKCSYSDTCPGGRIAHKLYKK
jgi:hypothetical protein